MCWRSSIMYQFSEVRREFEYIVWTGISIEPLKIPEFEEYICPNKSYKLHQNAQLSFVEFIQPTVRTALDLVMSASHGTFDL